MAKDNSMAWLFEKEGTGQKKEKDVLISLPIELHQKLETLQLAIESQNGFNVSISQLIVHNLEQIQNRLKFTVGNPYKPENPFQ